MKAIRRGRALPSQMKRQWSEGDGDRCGEERKRKCGRMRECPKSVLFGACLSAFLLLLFLGMRERQREREWTEDKLRWR